MLKKTITFHSLPYPDAKDLGAADFYFGINATFRFIARKFGLPTLQRYWREMGGTYFAPVTVLWKRGGLPAVAEYWREFFQAEPGGEVSIESLPGKVLLRVHACPAISHLRKHGREICPQFCQHCYFVSEAMARPAGLSVRITGGNGTCRQEFTAGQGGEPQNLEQISLCMT